MMQGCDTVLYLYCKTVSRSFFSFFFIVIINCFIILLPLWRIKFHIIDAVTTLTKINVNPSRVATNSLCVSTACRLRVSCCVSAACRLRVGCLQAAAVVNRRLSIDRHGRRAKQLVHLHVVSCQLDVLSPDGKLTTSTHTSLCIWLTS